MTIHHISTACRRLLANFIVAVAVLCISPQVSALPTPTMNEGEMMGMADVVAEGEVSSVTLLRRWIGDRPGYDLGHERGEFEATLRIEKTLKGKNKVNETIRYFVEAYMEGKWNAPGRGFVYINTTNAITPGTKLRVYLKWNAENKRYERVAFNSGFEVLKASDQAYPETVGVPSLARNKPAEQSVGGDGKPAPQP
jgi:hypothetical protein